MGKTILFTFIILLLVQGHWCEKSTIKAVGQPQPRIVGGTNAVQGEFPYQGVLEIEHKVQ